MIASLDEVGLVANCNQSDHLVSVSSLAPISSRVQWASLDRQHVEGTSSHFDIMLVPIGIFGSMCAIGIR